MRNEKHFRLPAWLCLLCLVTAVPGFAQTQHDRRQALAPDNPMRDARIPAEQVMDAIGLKPGMVIGEAGAGRGYFTFKMINRVGESGAIYANDIEETYLEDLDTEAKARGITNIHPIMGAVDDPLFSRNDLEMVFIGQSFHMFEKKTEWLVNCKKYLRPGATLVILDVDMERMGMGHGEMMSRSELIGYATQAGYEQVAVDDTFLRRDMLLVFRPSE